MPHPSRFFLGALALYLIEIYAEWEPLNSHDAYMRAEYGDTVSAFLIGELKIDKFLLDLEAKLRSDHV